MHKFPKFTQAWNSTGFWQFLCPSSGVYSLYTRHWCMSYSFRAEPSWSCLKAVFKPVWEIPVPSVQWINSRWWAEELPETCRVSCQSRFGKLMHLVGFIIKKFVTMQHGHVKIVRLCMLNSIHLRYSHDTVRTVYPLNLVLHPIFAVSLFHISIVLVFIILHELHAVYFDSFLLSVCVLPLCVFQYHQNTADS